MLWFAPGLTTLTGGCWHLHVFAPRGVTCFSLSSTTPPIPHRDSARLIYCQAEEHVPVTNYFPAPKRRGHVNETHAIPRKPNPQELQGRAPLFCHVQRPFLKSVRDPTKRNFSKMAWKQISTSSPKLFAHVGTEHRFIDRDGDVNLVRRTG